MGEKGGVGVVGGGGGGGCCGCERKTNRLLFFADRFRILREACGFVSLFIRDLLNVTVLFCNSRCQKHYISDDDDDDELMLNVLRCHETY